MIVKEQQKRFTRHLIKKKKKDLVDKVMALLDKQISVAKRFTIKQQEEEHLSMWIMTRQIQDS